MNGEKMLLLVEDEAIVAMAKARYLKKHGFDVNIASDGDSAITMIRNEKKVDLILMDIDLGKGIDGIEAAREILKEREIPVIFLTAHAGKDVLEKAREITRYGFVLKTAGDPMLLSSIEMAFELFQAYTASKENERRYRSITSLVADYAFSLILSPAGKLHCEWHAGDLGEVIGLDIAGPEPERLIAHCHPEDRPQILRFIDQLLAGENGTLEFRVVDRHGLIRWIQVHARPDRDAGAGKSVRISGFMKNITEQRRSDENRRTERTLQDARRRRAEKEVRLLLEEKELLLREVHTRVKNQMEAITGLIGPGSGAAGNPMAIAALQELQSRIQGMLLIYDRFFWTNDFIRVNAGKYLEDLVDDIVRTVILMPRRIGIRKNLQDLHLSSKSAFHLGVILNELLCLVVKHAFPGDHAGRIAISVTREASGEGMLVIGDEGTGIAREPEAGYPGDFGLHIIHILLQQIGGVLEWQRNGETVYCVHFPL